MDAWANLTNVIAYFILCLLAVGVLLTFVFMAHLITLLVRAIRGKK